MPYSIVFFPSDVDLDFEPPRPVRATRGKKANPSPSTAAAPTLEVFEDFVEEHALSHKPRPKCQPSASASASVASASAPSAPNPFTDLISDFDAVLGEEGKKPPTRRSGRLAGGKRRVIIDDDEDSSSPEPAEQPEAEKSKCYSDSLTFSSL